VAAISGLVPSMSAGDPDERFGVLNSSFELARCAEVGRRVLTLQGLTHYFPRGTQLLVPVLKLAPDRGAIQCPPASKAAVSGSFL
jgi:hypothetical protein